jgi:hypothetical protein
MAERDMVTHLPNASPRFIDDEYKIKNYKRYPWAFSAHADQDAGVRSSGVGACGSGHKSIDIHPILPASLAHVTVVVCKEPG